MENWSNGHSAFTWVQKLNFGLTFDAASRLYAKFDCPSGQPELFTFSDCAWLWNWLIGEKHKKRTNEKHFKWKLLFCTQYSYDYVWYSSPKVIYKVCHKYWTVSLVTRRDQGFPLAQMARRFALSSFPGILLFFLWIFCYCIIRVLCKFPPL